jgi:hypothetical protein
MHSLDIQAFTYQERAGVLPTLTHSFADCGGWVLDRKTLSAIAIEFRIELQLRSILDLYASLLTSGLELTRSSHIGLTELCTCRKHQHSTSDLGRIIALRLEISFLEDVTLHSLLSTASAPA